MAESSFLERWRQTGRKLRGEPSPLEIRKEERERLNKFIKENPDYLTPLEYKMKDDEITRTGTFTMPGEKNNDGGIAGIDFGQDPLTKSAPNIERRLGASKKPSPNDIVVVEPAMAQATGLPVGTQVQRWQIDRVFAPKERAATMATGQTQRQGRGIVEGQRKEASQFRQNLAKTAYSEFLKAKQLGTEDDIREEVADALARANFPEEEVERFRTKQIPPEEEENLFSQIFGKGKEVVKDVVLPKKTGVKVTPKQKIVDDKETSTRRRDPNTNKWWIFEGGQWRLE